MTLMQYFHDKLSDYYPRGSACCFYPDTHSWQQLCHILPASKANYKLAKRAYCYDCMIDMPLLNVICGSRYANDTSPRTGGYTTKIASLPYEVIRAGQCAIVEYAAKHCNPLMDIPVVKSVLSDKLDKAMLLNLQDVFYSTLNEALTKVHI